VCTTAVDAGNAKSLVLFGTPCSTTKRLPASAILSTGLTTCGEIAVASGGLADLWRGEYQGAQVAIKAFRTYSHMETAKEVRIERICVVPFKLATQILWSFVPMWKNFDHPNVAAFLGVNTEIFPLALVYDWAGNDNIIRYLESHTASPRLLVAAALV